MCPRVQRLIRHVKAIALNGVPEQPLEPTSTEKFQQEAAEDCEGLSKRSGFSCVRAVEGSWIRKCVLFDGCTVVIEIDLSDVETKEEFLLRFGEILELGGPDGNVRIKGRGDRAPTERKAILEAVAMPRWGTLNAEKAL
jgi:hypothetical protein